MKFRLLPKILEIGKVYEINQVANQTDLFPTRGTLPYRNYFPVRFKGQVKITSIHPDYKGLYQCIAVNSNNGRSIGSHLIVLRKSFMSLVK